MHTRIDRAARRTGQWFLTGSQESGLMRNVTESMAGRAAILQLMPMSVRESRKVTLLRGGFPEVLARPSVARVWFGSYLQTYIERDVRSVPGKAGAVRLVEAKATRTVTPAMVAPMQRIASAYRERDPRRRIEMVVVHRPARFPVRPTALAPGVRAVPWQDFVEDALA